MHRGVGNVQTRHGSRNRGKRSDLKISLWKDDEDQEGASDTITYIDDVAIGNADMVHVEMLDDDLAYIAIYGVRGTDDFIQLDVRIVDGRLRIYEP